MSYDPEERELTPAEIEELQEQARQEAIATGHRLIETYACLYEISEEQYADPDWMLALEEAAKAGAEMGLEDAGYIATSEPKAEFTMNIFPVTREFVDEDGNAKIRTMVGAWRGSIKGYRP